MSKKLINRYTDEELLKVLEDSTPESQKDQPLVVDNSHDIEEFILNYNLLPGEYKYTLHQLYIVYRDWSKTPVKNRTFIEEVLMYFPTAVKLPDKSRYEVSLNYPMAEYFKVKERVIKKRLKKIFQFNLKHWEWIQQIINLEQGKDWLPIPVLYNLYDREYYLIHGTYPLLSEARFNNLLKRNFTFEGNCVKVNLTKLIEKYGLEKINDLIKHYQGKKSAFKKKVSRSGKDVQSKVEK